MKKVKTIWKDQMRQVETTCSLKKPNKLTPSLEETAHKLSSPQVVISVCEQCW